MGDATIVRNRAKIEATLANARAVVRTRKAGERFAELVWSFVPPARPPVAMLDELPAATEESRALSKVLKARGFRFVGPTTAYALMQACGLVNDHLEDCFVRAEVEAEQAAARGRFRRGEAS